LASVDLTGIWLALLSDLETQLHFTKVKLSSPEDEVPGEFQAFANGVIRLIRGSGKFRTVPVEILEVTREERETLASWQGELMLYRDSRGRLLYGTFLNLRTPELQGSAGLCDASFDFGAVTHSPEV
jgi:hypothetical protein